MIAARLANLGHGGDRRGEDFKGSIDPSVSLDDAAEALKVSRPSVQRAKRILKDGTPEEIEAVEQGVRARCSAVAAGGGTGQPAGSTLLQRARTAF